MVGGAHPGLSLPCSPWRAMLAMGGLKRCTRFGGYAKILTIRSEVWFWYDYSFQIKYGKYVEVYLAVVETPLVYSQFRA